MKSNYKKLIICMLLVIGLCLVQIINNRLLILGVLILFLFFEGQSCLKNYSFPILLFFLPWAPLLKIGVGATSFYSLGLILICGISLLSKKFKCKSYQLLLTIFLLIITLFAKLLGGNSIDSDYIMFMILFFLFPVVKEEVHIKNYDFKECLIFFCTGIISAAILAKELFIYSNIAKYVTVHTIKSIVRLSGFYGDPNFYSAHITAAIAGCLIIFLNVKRRKEYLLISVLIVILLYCGMLSSSKSFIIVATFTIIVWILEIMFMKKKIVHKLIIISCIVLAGVFIVSSVEFNELLQMQVQRFSNANNVSNLTTGRSDLWKMYIEEISQNARIFFVGQGLSNILVQGRASHNTLIQIIYQFGIIGVIGIITWIILFFKKHVTIIVFNKKNFIKYLILAIGIFLPWMALDMLYFDEFFLMFMLTYCGIEYIREENGQVG